MVGTSGTQQCGGVFKEERFPVVGCFVTLEANTPLTVSVQTSLDKNPRDESFAIDNVVIRATGKGSPAGICVREQCCNVLIDSNMYFALSNVACVFHT